jgi:hypothetical protein
MPKKRKKQDLTGCLMSLDNIQLPSFLLSDLFGKSLYRLKSDTSKKNSGTISFLGDNIKKICILVHSPGVIYLPDEDLNFLLGILTACKISMADIALVNISNHEGLTYEDITNQFAAEKIFLFGIDTETIKLPLKFPHYQLQHFNDQVYLSSVPLHKLQTNKQEKVKLWNSLKRIFSIE